MAAQRSLQNRFGDSCDTTSNPLTLVQRNDTTGLYEVVRTVSEEEYQSYRESLLRTNNRLRRLSSSFQAHVIAPFYTIDTAKSQDSSSPRSLQDNNDAASAGSLSMIMDPDDPGAIVLGRECSCSPVEGTYCPVGNQYCKIELVNPYQEKLGLSCTTDTDDAFSLFVLPLTVFLFIFFCCLCQYSPRGRYAKGYAKKVACCWDEGRYEQSLNDALNRMAQQHFDQHRRMERIRTYQVETGRVVIPRERPMLHGVISSRTTTASSPTNTSDIIVARQSVVVLKTTRYHGDIDMREISPEDQDEETCAICLFTFQEGDRVGNVRCGHVFHVECLKEWIQRKNHCPLCQMNNMATPQAETDLVRSRTETEETPVHDSSRHSSVTGLEELA